MELTEINPKHKKLLERKHITSVERLTRLFPNHQHDFTEPVELSEKHVGEMVAVEGPLLETKIDTSSGILMVNARILDEKSGKKLYLSWYRDVKAAHIIKEWKAGMRILAGGKLKFAEGYGDGIYTMNPLLYIPAPESGRYLCIYPKYKGLSEEKQKEYIKWALNTSPSQEALPEKMVREMKLMGEDEAVRTMHFPKDAKALKQARERLLFDDLLYYAIRLTEVERRQPVGSPFGFRSGATTYRLINELPYDLTADQKGALSQMIEQIKEGKRLNGIVIGDVGCGKTIVAFLAMFLMADSGYQSLMMAPTTVLASQHYRELKGYAERFGYEVAYLSGEQTAKERRQIEKGIREGRYTFIVGTHSVISKAVEYKNLGLAITDEEHKFGVLQRRVVEEKASAGVHALTMSATPIPRSLASTIYSRNTTIYRIATMPNGRLPVKTKIYSNEAGTLQFIQKLIERGEQAYVVCPLIEEAEEGSLMENIDSVESVYEKYRSFFEPKGMPVEVVTGKMAPEETKEVIGRFERGETKILVSTTVIEVGVNVPNATCIVINNAERFGLAGLHQLRGRVGRGKKQSYCILNSKEAENERLLAMCETNDGFELAEKDYQLRGSGDVAGITQSGQNKFIAKIVENPDAFNRIREITDRMMDIGLSDTFRERYEEIYPEYAEGDNNDEKQKIS